MCGPLYRCTHNHVTHAKYKPVWTLLAYCGLIETSMGRVSAYCVKGCVYYILYTPVEM